MFLIFIIYINFNEKQKCFFGCYKNKLTCKTQCFGNILSNSFNNFKFYNSDIEKRKLSTCYDTCDNINSFCNAYCQYNPFI